MLLTDQGTKRHRNDAESLDHPAKLTKIDGHLSGTYRVPCILVWENKLPSLSLSLSLSSGGGGRPTLPDLLRLKVPQEVGVHYTTFGILLLNDELGSRVDCIEEECRGKPEKICRKILQEWLEGKGLPVTWETLIQTLRNTELSTLADQIQQATNV